MGNLVNPFTTGLTIDASQQLVEDIVKSANIKRIAIMAPAGSGKTLAGIYFIYLMNSPRTVILSTRLSINQQWEAELKKFNNGMTIVNLSGNQRLPASPPDITICTEQKFKKLWTNVGEKMKPFIIIIDEAQNMLTPTVEYLYRIDTLSTLLLSATYPLSYSPKHDLLLKYFDKIHPVMRTSLSNKYIYYMEDLSSNVNTCYFVYRLREFLIEKKFKMLITTKLILSSLTRYARICKSYAYSIVPGMHKITCLLVRSGNAMSYLLPIDIGKEATSLLEWFIERETVMKWLASRYQYLTKFDEEENVEGLGIPSYEYPSYGVYPYDGIPTSPIAEKKFNELYHVMNSKLGATKFSPVDIRSYSFDDRLLEFMKILINDHQLTKIEYNSNIFQLLPKADVIISTNSRLQEGFNCPEIVFGVFHDFPFNYINRVQLLCRIRRISSDPFIKDFPRLAVTTISKPRSEMLEDEVRSLVLWDPNTHEHTHVNVSKIPGILFAWKHMPLTEHTKCRIKKLLNSKYSVEIEEEEMRRNNCLKCNTATFMKYLEWSIEGNYPRAT